MKQPPLQVIIQVIQIMLLLVNFLLALKILFVKHMEFQGGVNTTDSHSTASNKSASEKDSSIKANETLINSKNNIENIGLAVFHGDKLVGELTGIETICNHIISNNLETCTINIPSPFEDNTTISLRTRLLDKTKNSVELTENRTIYYFKSIS